VQAVPPQPNTFRRRSTNTENTSALARWLPHVAARIPWVTLGDWPTPIDRVEIDGRPIWIKREGESSSRYGGNKVRTLEAWLGHTLARSAQRIWAIGAYGSNHIVATVMHARALGLDAGAIVFPQPASEWAVENASALIGSGVPIVRLRNVVEVPFAGLAITAQSKWPWLAGGRTLGMLVGRELARGSIVMPPGGATPIGTIGALTAAFELAEQVAAGVAPAPRRIVVPAGSTCTTAGLLSGLTLAHAIGAWRWPLPTVHAVRVTPWPVTSRLVITRLAAATLARIASLGGPRVELDSRLIIDAGEIGRGYGEMTPRGLAAIDTFRDHARLDGVYSGKAAAALMRLHARHVEPLLFWSTKASTLLPAPSVEALAAAPAALVEWTTSYSATASTLRR
jgi:1-aminocyclopropane-1-carboxylate deaminase/D-cysteine desulfhydrase-like pyridoxal-dependent ACC family enzyme